MNSRQVAYHSVRRFNTTVKQMTIKIDNLEEFLKQKRDLQKSAKEKDMHMMFDFKKPRELVLVCHSMLDKQKFDPFRKLDDFAKIINSVVKKSVQEIPGDDEICFLCEQPMADKYRLLQCSHAFHLNCLKQKLEGVETSDDFICPIPDCFCRPHPGETPADEVEDRILEPENPVPAKPKRTGIVLYDILCLFTEPERELLFSKMKYQFLIQFKSRFRYCPTPNCDNILERVPRTLNPEGKDEPDNGIDRDKLFCTSCGNDTCFECGRSHFGEEQSCRKEKPSRQRVSPSPYLENKQPSQRRQRWKDSLPH